MIATLDTLTPKRRATKMKSSRPRSYEYHETILAAETVELLAAQPGKVIVDGTLGGGGHAAALLAAGARVIGIDQDPEAIAFARQRLGDAADFTAVQGNFAKLDEVLAIFGIKKVDGILVDLGVSSRQLDSAERGFSFMHDGPLDMRMAPDGPITAADLVNTMSGEQLERIFRQLGEEPAARKVAAKLVRERMVQPFTTTLQLASAVEAVIPRRGRTHPATRVFQGLRIAVNRELEVLETALEVFTAHLAPGGRLATLTFHSLEDRIVKTFFKERTAEFIDRAEWPAARPNPLHLFNAVTRKPVIASEAEQRANPRSRSAKLRVVERIAHAHE